jgi:hypothetical protein
MTMSLDDILRVAAGMIGIPAVNIEVKEIIRHDDGRMDVYLIENRSFERIQFNIAVSEYTK